MRKYLIVLFCAVVALSACEVIPDGERFDPVGKIESRRVVLLEEFTGVQCTNCPAAAKVAQSLLSEYPDNLVVVGLHGRNTGDFGKPFENEQDFRISDVEAYYDEFGPTDGYPCGMVNRATPEKPNMEGSKVTNSDLWAAEVVRALLVQPSAGLYIERMPDESLPDSVVKVAVTVESFEQVEHQVSLVVELLEDGIVGSQINGGDVDTNYVHNHVLRTVVNGTWGESFTMPAVGEISSPKVFEITVRKPWVKENCSVVAYLYNSETRGDVMQAAILPLGEGAAH